MYVNNEFRSLMVGMLLGAGFIAVDRKHDLYYLSFQHALRQEEYALHKAAVLSELCEYRCTIDQISAGTTRNPAVRVQFTLPRGEGRYYRALFYPNGNKTVTRHCLNWMNEQALAWWYQDDGVVSVYTNPKTMKTARSIKWCTHSFTKDENETMQQYLATVYGISATVRIEKRQYYYLSLGAHAARRLIGIVSPYVHLSMRSKLDLKD